MSVLRSAALYAALMLPMGALPAAASVFYTITGTGGFPVYVLDDEGNNVTVFEIDDEGNEFSYFLTENVFLPFEAVFTAPDFISSYQLVVPNGSMIGDGTTYFVTELGFDPGSPNTWGGTDTFVDFKYDSNIGLGGGGFLFFQAGALGAPGVYFTDGFPQGTPGFGNFGTARLSVFDWRDIGVIPLPASLPLLLGGLGMLALFRRRRA